MHPVYNHIRPVILPVSLDNWLTILQKPIRERPNFKVSEGTVFIGQVIVRFLGLPVDEDEYYDNLYELTQLKNLRLILLTKEILDKKIDDKVFQSIHKMININQKENISIDNLIENLDRENILLKTEDPSYQRKIKESFAKMLTLFSSYEKQKLNSQEFQKLLLSVISWLSLLKSQIKNIDPIGSMPKFLLYGDFHKSHRYFIYFLMEMGCDLIIFSPSGKDVLSYVDPNKERTLVFTFPNFKAPEPFPTEKRSRKATVAYRAEKEIETILNQDGSVIYKPWQLRDYIPCSITLKTTYEEIFLIGKEKAMFRPEFEAARGIVKIPCIFAKVQGVSKKRHEYWERMYSICEMEQSLLITHFPIMRGVNYDIRFHYKSTVGADGLLSVEKMMASHYWKYYHLPLGLQKGIGNAIKNICAKPFLKPINNETLEHIKIYLFTHGLQMPANILKLLQQFDYSQEVPKLILYNNEMNGVITRADAALLLLLNEIGIDIIVYNPAGGNDIENYIDKSLFDIHWLEDVVFELEYKEPSAVRKLWRQRILKNLRRLQR